MIHPLLKFPFPRNFWRVYRTLLSPPSPAIYPRSLIIQSESITLIQSRSQNQPSFRVENFVAVLGNDDNVIEPTPFPRRNKERRRKGWYKIILTSNEYYYPPTNKLLLDSKGIFFFFSNFLLFTENWRKIFLRDNIYIYIYICIPKRERERRKEKVNSETAQLRDIHV